MSTIAHATDEHGEFGISISGGIIYCTVNSETREDAEAVCDSINRDARDLEALRSGHEHVLPTSREHAHNLLTVSKDYLSDNLYDD